MLLRDGIKIIESHLVPQGNWILVEPNTVFCDGKTYDTIAAALGANEMTPLYDLLEEANGR